MRTLTVHEYVLEELNKLLAAQGRDVQIVSERPRPQLVANNVVKFETKEQSQ